MLKRLALPLLSVAMLAYAGQAEEPKTAPDDGIWKILMSQGVKLPETAKVKASYLGMGTEAADARLRAQLKLPEGVGLAVTYVEKDGPAEVAGIRVHDVLYKLNEQFLVNTPQLVTLVRMHKPGESLELTVIREAQPSKRTVKLVEREVSPLESFTTGGMGLDGTKVLSWVVPHQVQGGDTSPLVLGGTGFMVSASIVTIADDEYQVEVDNTNGQPRMTVKDKSGKVLYEGKPDPEAKEVPESLRAKIRMVPDLIREETELVKPQKQAEKDEPPAVRKPDGF